MNFILNEDDYYPKRKKNINIFQVLTISIILIVSIILIKFKPAYAVTLGEEEIGFVNNRTDIQNVIDNDVLAQKDETVAFVALDNVEYSFEFVDRTLIDDNTVITKIKESSKNIYSVYEVSDGNDEDAVYVNTLEEAENLVNTLKSDYSALNPNLAITTLYLEEPATSEAINNAKAKIAESLNNQLIEKRKRDKRTVNGIYLASLPLKTGTVSSRFGSVESVRDHVHGGLDLAASYGSPIMAVADGTVTFAGQSGGYGNLVIVKHGNGVETYYGHCSSITTNVGAEVKAGDTIAKVGSTGNSTGNHLHFEIRINGGAVNPQKYIY